MATLEEAHLTATEARVHFGELLDRVTGGSETVILTRGGQPVAAVISIDRYRSLTRPRLSDEWWESRRLIADEYRRNLAGRPRPTARELINAGRD